MTRFKDANECLKAGVSGAVLMGCLAGAFDFAPEKVVAAEQFRERFMAKWFEEDLETGLRLPWQFPFRVRMGELTLWLGVEGSGKTTLLDFVIVCLMAQGERALIASFEWPAADTLQKISRQVWGGVIYDKEHAKWIEAKDGTAARAKYEETAREAARVTFDWMAGSYPDGGLPGQGSRLWMYEHCGIGRWRELLEDIRWARRRYGITQFVVDNFMRLGIRKDDYAEQAEAITAFAAAAMELEVHIHVVLHQNKSERGKGPTRTGQPGGGKNTAAGAFEILANAHNIVEVQRDEVKGKKMAELFARRKIDAKFAAEEFEKEKAAQDLVPDGKFTMLKQRAGRHQDGAKYLWFLWKAQQYVDRPPSHKDHGPVYFLESNQADLPENDLPTSEEMEFPTTNEHE